jgi:hypothetical protein
LAIQGLFENPPVLGAGITVYGTDDPTFVITVLSFWQREPARWYREVGKYGLLGLLTRRSARDLLQNA